MKAGLAVVVVLVCAVAATSVAAKGGSRGGAGSPGTGSKTSSSHVHGYVKKDGTYVEPHRRSTPDGKFENNWTTKGNDNIYTGKDGTRVTEPAKK